MNSLQELVNSLKEDERFDEKHFLANHELMCEVIKRNTVPLVLYVRKGEGANTTEALGVFKSKEMRYDVEEKRLLFPTTAYVKPIFKNDFSGKEIESIQKFNGEFPFKAMNLNLAMRFCQGSAFYFLNYKGGEEGYLFVGDIVPIYFNVDTWAFFNFLEDPKITIGGMKALVSNFSKTVDNEVLIMDFEYPWLLEALDVPLMPHILGLDTEGENIAAKLRFLYKEDKLHDSQRPLLMTGDSEGKTKVFGSNEDIHKCLEYLIQQGVHLYRGATELTLWGDVSIQPGQFVLKMCEKYGFKVEKIVTQTKAFQTKPEVIVVDQDANKALEEPSTLEPIVIKPQKTEAFIRGLASLPSDEGTEISFEGDTPALERVKTGEADTIGKIPEPKKSHSSRGFVSWVKMLLKKQ